MPIQFSPVIADRPRPLPGFTSFSTSNSMNSACPRPGRRAGWLPG